MSEEHGRFLEDLITVDACLIGSTLVDLSHEVSVTSHVVAVQTHLVVKEGLAPKALEVICVMIHAVVHENGLE